MKEQNKTSYHFWSLTEQEVLDAFSVEKEKGLAQEEVLFRQKSYGRNILQNKNGKGIVRLLLRQFNSPLIYMLLFAALLSLLLCDTSDAFIILTIVFISALLSFFQEKSAVKTMEKLLKMVQIKVDVIRDGVFVVVGVEELVPGDIVKLQAGGVVPADCYILLAKDLFVDEATLTGETLYSEKSPGTLSCDTPLAKRTNALFMGTHVASGTATAIVMSIGKNTVFGALSEQLAGGVPETEFEQGVRKFGYFLGEITLLLLLIIFAFNVYLERAVIESMLFSLALAVGLTPQLLPAIISINLAHGAKLMAKKHVIVKRLAAIENFGSMNILCSDKTGTLTSDQITLDKAFGIDGKPCNKLLLYASLNAFFQTSYTNPLDRAILAQKQNFDGWNKLDEIPYDFFRKKMSVLVREKECAYLITKGAFNQVLASCSYAEDSSGKQVPIDTVMTQLQACYAEYSENGLRVLGLAWKDLDGKESATRQVEQDMVFLGFLLFYNPLKEGIEQTIAELEELGVELKIITGDNRLVASHMAQLIGIDKDKVLTGTMLHQIDDRALIHIVKKIKIFAEVEPTQKERIILALRKSGNVVGFMGDGINDVTALHAADVSISVESATDAAKEVADIVLLAGDLSVLKDGVRAGRLTFANTMKYIFMSTSANFGNMFSMAGASLFLSFLPLLPKQVLLTNLLTDFPEMTIATDSVDDEMVQKPLRWDIHFIRRFMLVFGLISSVFDFATFGLLLWLQAGMAQFRTGWFVESVVSASLIVLVIRTFKPFYSSRPSRPLLLSVLAVTCITPILAFTPFASTLGFVPLPWYFYLCIGALIAAYVASVEIAKKYFLKKIRRQISAL